MYEISCLSGCYKYPEAETYVTEQKRNFCGMEVLKQVQNLKNLFRVFIKKIPNKNGRFTENIFLSIMETEVLKHQVFVTERIRKKIKTQKFNENLTKTQKLKHRIFFKFRFFIAGMQL